MSSKYIDQKLLVSSRNQPIIDALLTNHIDVIIDNLLGFSESKYILLYYYCIISFCIITLLVKFFYVYRILYYGNKFNAIHIN